MICTWTIYLTHKIHKASIAKDVSTWHPEHQCMLIFLSDSINDPCLALSSLSIQAWQSLQQMKATNETLHSAYFPPRYLFTLFFFGNTQRGWYHHWSVYQRLEWLSCKASILQVLLKLLSFFLLCFKVLALRETLSQQRESSLTWGTDEPANLSPDTQVSAGVVPNSKGCSAYKLWMEPWKCEAPVTYIWRRFGMNWACPDYSDAVVGKV